MTMMLQIRSLERLSSDRYLVTLEDDSFFPLYEKELAGYGIEEGGMLAEASYQEILCELLPRRARHKAMYLLQSMDRTEYQLRRKLQECSYPEEVIEDAVQYVKGFHYIDDVRYARNYVEFRKERKSLKQLEQELYQKGVSREDFEEAVSELEVPEEEEQILAWIEKKQFHPETADQKETDRFLRFLLRKGYRISSIKQAFQKL